MGDAGYLLERTMIRGLLFTRSRSNVWINHICLRLHDLRGPFKYGRYRTEYDSTVVNGYARGLAHKFSSLPFLLSLFMTSFDCTSPAKVRSFHCVRIYTRVRPSLFSSVGFVRLRPCFVGLGHAKCQDIQHVYEYMSIANMSPELFDVSNSTAPPLCGRFCCACGVKN